MEHSVTCLKEGITFHYLPSDKFTSNFFSIHFLVPLREETASHYSLLAKVLKKGSRAYPTQEKINKRMEELYATGLSAGVAKIGEAESFFFSLDALDNRFSFDGTDISGGAFALLSSLLKEPHLENGVFLESTVEREKEALKDRIRAAINNKATYAANRCREIMCENEAYRFSLDGKEENVDEISSASLYDAYLHILNEAQIEIFYIGAEDFALVSERARRLTGSLSPRAPLATPLCVSSDVHRVTRKRETVNAVQGKLVMGFRTGCTLLDEDVYALMLFGALYGSSPVSKLFMNVREKLSLCYYCTAKSDLNKGVMFVSSGVENQNAEAAETEILRQLDEIRAGNITEKELVCAKESLRDSLRSLSDSPNAIEAWYLNRSLSKNAPTPEEVMAKIDATTVREVMDIANKITLDTVFFLEGTGEKEENANV